MLYQGKEIEILSRTEISLPLVNAFCRCTTCFFNYIANDFVFPLTQTEQCCSKIKLV